MVPEEEEEEEEEGRKGIRTLPDFSQRSVQKDLSWRGGNRTPDSLFSGNRLERSCKLEGKKKNVSAKESEGGKKYIKKERKEKKKRRRR